jgi:phosphonate transport system substrate-binding protein
MLSAMKRSAFFCLCLTWFLAGCSKQPQVLRFSAIPDQNSTELKEKFDALGRYLESKLNIKIEYVPVNDYKASVEMFKTGDIQLAWFGALTSIQAIKAVSGARAIAQGDTDPHFKSYFIAHASTGLQKADKLPASLKDFTFTFGSESSTSGRFMPEYFLRKEFGKAPKELFAKPPLFSGSHDKTIELVASGQVQLGAVNYEVYEERVHEGKVNAEQCRVIWITPDYPDYNFTAHPLLDQRYGAGFIDRLQQALVDIKDPELLKVFPRKALIPAKNEDYSVIEQIAKDLGFVR